MSDPKPCRESSLLLITLLGQPEFDEMVYKCFLFWRKTDTTKENQSLLNKICAVFIEHLSLAMHLFGHNGQKGLLFLWYFPSSSVEHRSVHRQPRGGKWHLTQAWASASRDLSCRKGHPGQNPGWARGSQAYWRGMHVLGRKPEGKRQCNIVQVLWWGAEWKEGRLERWEGVC